MVELANHTSEVILFRYKRGDRLMKEQEYGDLLAAGAYIE